MKVKLRLDPATRERLEQLARLTEKSVSAVATELLRVSCPLASDGVLLVPMDLFMTVVAVEGGLAHRMSPSRMMSAYLDRGRKCYMAKRESPLVQDLLKHLGGDVFASSIDRMTERPFVRFALQSTHGPLTQLSAVLADEVVGRAQAWSRDVRVPTAALIRLALQPNRMPFVLVPVPVFPERVQEITASAHAHGLSTWVEAALWAWNGMFDYFVEVTAAKGRLRELLPQIQHVLRTQALPHIWRWMTRTILRHPADAWVLAQLMWHSPLDDVGRVSRYMVGEPTKKDAFLAGLPESGDRYLYGSLGIDRMMQDVLHPPEPENEEAMFGEATKTVPA